MDVPISHILGTAALIGLVISAALAYQIIVGYVETNVLKSQLKQTAEYVSMNLVNLISLTEFAYGGLSTPSVMIKTLNLPKDLSEKPYLVRLVNESGKCYIKVELVTRSDLYAKSPIPLNSTNARITIATEDVITRITADFPDDTITLSSVVYGGNPNIVVWCWKNTSDLIYAGLGSLTGGGT